MGKPPSSSHKPKLYYVTPFPKSSVLPKVDKTNALSKPVTSNSAPSTRESKVVQTVNVISPRIFRINPSKTSKVDNVVPNKPVKTSIRIKRITVSQPNVIHKQQANSDSNTAKTRSPHSRINSNTDRVPSKSKSSCLSNNVEKIEENHRNSQIPNNQKHMSSECNNITLAIQNDKSEIFAMCGKLTASSNIENQSEKSVCDNASTYNPSKPSCKGFPNSASLLGKLSRLRKNILLSIQLLFSNLQRWLVIKCQIATRNENVCVSAFILNNEKRNLFVLELLSKHLMFVSSSQWLMYTLVHNSSFR
ncbi:hypothetical protein Tco_1382550 [Tanacetum coccineum]